MKKFTLSGLIAAVGMTCLLAAAGPQEPQAAPMPVVSEPTIVSTIEGVPTEALPRSGECRIFFDNVAIHKQPASMECEHAHWLARSWGGRVVATEGLSATVVAEYEGRNDFTGVPSEAIPPRGYCRAWLPNVAAEFQPEASDCIVARRLAADGAGRVLFMPI
jgi:hypothetical protein